jgi:hypothetical protein
MAGPAVHDSTHRTGHCMPPQATCRWRRNRRRTSVNRCAHASIRREVIGEAPHSFAVDGHEPIDPVVNDLRLPLRDGHIPRLLDR